MARWKRLGIAVASAAWLLPCGALLVLAAADKLVVERALALQLVAATLVLAGLTVGGWAWHASARRAREEPEHPVAVADEPSLVGVVGEDGTFRATPALAAAGVPGELARAIRAQMLAIDRIEQGLSGPSGLRHGQKEALQTLAHQLREEMRAQAEHDARRYGQQQEQRDVSIRSAVELLGLQLTKLLDQLQLTQRDGTAGQQAALQALGESWMHSLADHRQALEALLNQGQAQQQGGLVSLQDAFVARVDEAVAQLEERLAQQALALPSQLQVQLHEGLQQGLQQGLQRELQAAVAPVLAAVDVVAQAQVLAQSQPPAALADAELAQRLEGGMGQLQAQLAAIDAQLAQLHQQAGSLPQQMQAVSQHLATHEGAWQAMESQLGTRLSSHLAAAQASTAEQAQVLQASVAQLGDRLQHTLAEQREQQRQDWSAWEGRVGDALVRRWDEAGAEAAREQAEQAQRWQQWRDQLSQGLQGQEAALRQELAQWTHSQAEQARLQQIQAAATVGQVQQLSAALTQQIGEQLERRLGDAQGALLAASQAGLQQGLAAALERLEAAAQRGEALQQTQAEQVQALQQQGQALMEALHARVDAAVQAHQGAVQALAQRVGEQLAQLREAQSASAGALLQAQAEALHGHQHQAQASAQRHAEQQLNALEGAMSQWSGTLMAQLERSERAQRQSLQSHREVVDTLVQEIATDLHAARSQWAQLDAQGTPSELGRLQDQLAELALHIDQSLQSSELQRMGEQTRALESFQHFSAQVSQALEQLRGLGDRHEGVQQVQLQRLQVLQEALESQSRQQMQASQEAAVQREASRGAQVDALGVLAERMEQQLEAAWQRAAQAQERSLAEQQAGWEQLRAQTERLADAQAALRQEQQAQAQATEALARQQAEQLAMSQAVERRLAVLSRLEEKVETAQALLAELGADRLGERLAEVQGFLSSRVPRLLDDRLSQVNDLLSRQGQTMEAWFTQHEQVLETKLHQLGQGMETAFDGMRERMTAHAALGDSPEARADDPRVRKIYLNLADLQETLRRERRMLAERLRAAGPAH